ncbi:hypothetical protein ACFC09_15680 [Streptomyces sp. NPDC056161]|uniref:hypothetical protein n=1 Tax=Streptomyces sp. NPDC056161 TaxID=3345732 RepID=UPI0035DC0B10
MAAETGIPALDTILVWGGALSLAGGLATGVWRIARGGARLGRRVDEFIDDWQGEPSRPGVPARLGVMERMVGLESRMGGVEQDLRRIKHELYPNSGGSLRDAVDLANHRLSLLCPDETGPTGVPDLPGTAVPPRDTAGEPGPAAGDTGETTLHMTSEDPTGDSPGDTGDSGDSDGPAVPTTG